MARRLSWFITGTGFGIGASIWARRKIRSKVQEITPVAVSKAAIDSVSIFKEKFQVALGAAKAEATATEAALRQEMGLGRSGKGSVK